MLRRQHVILFYSRQYQIHGLHILRQRGAVSLALMIYQVRFNHLWIYREIMTIRETKDTLFYHLNVFIGQIFGVAWLPLVFMNTHHCICTPHQSTTQCQILTFHELSLPPKWNRQTLCSHYDRLRGPLSHWWFAPMDQWWVIHSDGGSVLSIKVFPTHVLLAW